MQERSSSKNSICSIQLRSSRPAAYAHVALQAKVAANQIHVITFEEMVVN